MRNTGELESLAREGSLSRREFLKVAAAIGVTGATASTMWSSSAYAAPRKGGTLKVGISEGPISQNFNPTETSAVYNYVSRWSVFNNLVELDHNKRPTPELAESWQVSDDAKEWVFNLRKGVEFQNGKTLTAEDVVYSINLHRGDSTKSPSKVLLDIVDEVKAESADQVKFKLKSGWSEFVYVLADYYLYIVPQDFSNWDNPVGTGGYLLESWEERGFSRYIRSPNYWKPDRAWVDSVELSVISDPTARIASLRSGGMHAVNAIDTKIAQLIESQPGLRTVVSPSQGYQNTLMRSDTGPFADNNVRLAFKNALPREQILNVLIAGYGTAGNDHCVPPSDPYFNSELPQRVFDPEKAKWHLGKAGLDRLSIDVYTSSAAGPQATDAAVLIKKSAKDAHIDLNIVQSPADGYWKEVWRKQPLCMSHWPMRPTPSMQMELVYRSDSPWNDTYFKDERFDNLLKELRVTLNDESRKAIYWDLQEILHENGGAGVYAFYDSIDAYSESVGGAEPDAVRTLSGCRISERVWLDT